MDPMAIVGSVISGVILLAFRALNNTIKELANSVTELKTEVAILHVNRDRIDDHEQRIRVLEQK